ncbi:MAG TPA: pitrilysin family protein, partial [bacterium]|nr:pitrilysin family protein [bacterium]
QEDALSSLAFAELLKNLYPKHPYGLRSLGTAESVKKLNRSHLARFHREIFKARNLVLSVVGDVSVHEVEKLANELLGELPRGGSKPLSVKPDPRPGRRRESEIVKKNKQQSHIAMGFMGTTFKDPDRHAMTVLNNIMAGQGGRLFLTLRDRMSLAYAVSSVNHEGMEPGYFAVYIGTEPGKTGKAVEGILAELGKITSEKVAADELERSKQYLVGTYELDLQRTSTVAGIYAFNEIYGLPMQEIELYPQRILAVTAEDVLRVAKKFITPESYTLSIVRPS